MAEHSFAYHDPHALVQTAWLEAHLQDPTLRIFDCTTHLLPADATTDAPYRIRSGRAEYEQGHIPGAGFLDLQGELSDNTTKLRFMLPSVEQFASIMSHYGVGDNTRAILYSAGGIMWATRVWWMLRAFGFDNAAVLDGGWDKWQAEERLVSIAPCTYPSTVFTPRPRPELFVGKNQVLATIQDPNTIMVNALSPDLHQGTGPSRYGRAGHIPGSVNVPAATLIDQHSRAFVSLAEAQKKFTAAGVKEDQQVIAYCGGGISATVDLYLLHQLGYDNLTLYDGSMGEWAKDESLPIEKG